MIYILGLYRIYQEVKVILVRYNLADIEIIGEATPKFLLTCNGAYFYNNPNSKYRGLFFPNEDSLFKTIDFIKIEEIESINYDGDVIEIISKKGILKCSFIKDNLVIDLDYKGELVFTFDIRDIYDFDDKGRIYTLNKDSEIILEYKKFRDNMLESISFKKYVLIRTNYEYVPIMQWKEEEYSEDKLRKSNPSKLFIFDAFKLRCSGKDQIRITFADDIQTAKKNLETEEIRERSNLTMLDSDEETVAYNLSIKSVYDLYVQERGFYAGLPWFFQIWTRDEAISLKSLMIVKDYELCRERLLEMLKNLDSDGKLPNRFPRSTLATADGTGWMYLRLHDLMKLAQGTNRMEQYFSKRNIELINSKIKFSIERQKTEGYLIRNKALETWMDTSYKEDTREGFRIEIQALWLAMLRFSNYIDTLIGRNERYKDLERFTRKKVKENYYSGRVLKDGNDDETIRPNIFLAYYIYPGFLEKSEWEKAFDLALERLWLDWGGLSSIDKTSSLFCQNYSGENNISYHRGDSWYFVNNIAAICLMDLNPSKYNVYIDKIKKASTKDILWRGILGRASEISSAGQQKAEGSLFQLWSCATYIEMQNVKIK